MSLLHRLSAKLDAALHRFEKLDLGYTYDEMYGPHSLGCSTDSKKTQYPNLYVNRTKGDVMDIPETGKAVVEYVLTGRNMSKRDGKTTYGMDLQIKSFDPQGTKKADAKMKKDGHAVAMSEFARGDQIQKLANRLGRLLPAGRPRKMDALERSVARRGRLAKTKYKEEGVQVIRDQMAKTLKGIRSARQFSEFSDRTRNGDGQFVGNVTGGADPVTMRQAYGEKPKRSLLAPGVGAAVKVEMSNTEGRMTNFGSMGLKRLNRVSQALDGTRKQRVKFAPWDAHGAAKGSLRSGVAKKASYKTEQAGIRDGVKWDADGKRKLDLAHKLNNEQRARSVTLKKFSQFSDRTRNGDGQFVANVTGGADPVTMRQAYGEKPKRSLLAPGVGAAALAGAGLLGTKSGRVMTSRAAKGAARMVRSTVAGIDRKASGKTGAMWPRMGGKAKPKVQRREGLGEVMYRQAAKSKTGARMPRFGD